MLKTIYIKIHRRCSFVHNYLLVHSLYHINRFLLKNGLFFSNRKINSDKKFYICYYYLLIKIVKLQSRSNAFYFGYRVLSKNARKFRIKGALKLT